MNSDPSPANPTPGSNSSAPNRTSNLKSRWKRGPSPGVPPQRPAASQAVFGVVNDITSVRETISGQHAQGYAEPERPASPMSPATPPPPAPRAEAPRMEAPRPTPAPARPKEFSAPAPKDAPPPAPRREPPPPRQQNENRGGQREQYVALKPDPANDAAPRRLRTEASKPVPVEEYAPSTFARAPDKVIPAKNNREESREQNHSRSRESGRSPAASVKANATIPAQPSRTKDVEKPKAKSGGIVGFLKRFFGGGQPAAKSSASSPSSRDQDSSDRDERRSHRDGDRNRGRGDDRRSHHHRQGGHHSHHSQDNRRSGPDNRRDGRDGRDGRRGGEDRRGRS